MPTQKLTPTERKKMLKGMGDIVEAKGYNAIARDIRKGQRVKDNANYFLSMYKRTAYGTFHSMKKDGTIDRKGKIDSKARKMYDKVDMVMQEGLKRLAGGNKK